MKKKINSPILGLVAIFMLALLIAACNRGTGCPSDFGFIIPLF